MSSGGLWSWPSRPCEWPAKRLRGRPVSRTVTLRRARPSCRAPARPAKLPPMMMTSFMVMGSVSWMEGGGAFFLNFKCGSDLLQIGEERRPALFPQDLNRGALGGFPGRSQFFDLLAAFGRERQFHEPALPPSFDVDQTIPLQRLEISQQRRSLHPQYLAQIGHIRQTGGVQRRENRPLRAADSMAPHFCIKKLRHHPRYPPQVEAHAIL